MKTPDYLSYDRYKKKKDASPNKRIWIFVTTFFATLLFTVIAKSLSPNVDVTISDDSNTDAKETGLGVKKFIDDRLKMIQMEDNSAGVSVKDDNQPGGYNDKNFDNYSKKQELADEKVVLPTQRTKTIDDTQSNDSAPAVAPRPRSSDVYKPIETPKTAKVFVGRYSTIDQAKVAQGILLDSGLNITPFIKDLGGTYTLQVGSYSSRATANSVATQLQQNNFPARVVQE